MSELEPKENNLDAAATRLLDYFSQRTSRRGIIARIGKLALGYMGLTLIPNLPLDRSFVASAQSVSCSDRILCGLCGNLCNECCGGGGPLYECPSCTTRGHYGWSKCCPIDACGNYAMYEYWDCCGTVSGYTDSEAAACKGPKCENNCPQDVWCLDPVTLEVIGVYRCTVIVVGGSCTPS
jgi:hypothetical protein